MVIAVECQDNITCSLDIQLFNGRPIYLLYPLWPLLSIGLMLSDCVEMLN